jgi:hypothetical protein
MPTPKSNDTTKNSATAPAEQRFVNHVMLNNLRSGIDFLILVLSLRTIMAVQERLHLGKYPWTTCFTVAALYFKLRNTLNPLRDELGLYECLLFREERRRTISTSTETRSTINIFSGSPIITATTQPETKEIKETFKPLPSPSRQE